MRPARYAVLAVAVALFAWMVVRHEDPAMMLVGMAPLAWIAFEGLWRLLEPGGSAVNSESQADSRTGIRRDPNGLSNFP